MAVSGGGDLGGVDLEFTSNLKTVIKDVQNLRKELAGTDAPKLATQFDLIQKSLDKITGTFSPERLAPFESQLKDIQAELEAMGLKESEINRLRAAGVPIIDSVTAKTQAYGKTIANAEAAGAKLAAEEERQNRLRTAGVPVIDSVTRQTQAYGRVQLKAAEEHAKLTQAAQLQGGVFGKLRSIVSGVGDQLAKTGLTVRDVSIILGSGLLSGGIALIAREALRAVKALIELTIHLGELGAEVEHDRGIIEGVFGQTASDIEDFSRRTATALGLSEDAALRALGTLGKFFENLGADKQAASDLALETLKIATALRETSLSGKSLADIQSDLTSFLEGSTSALREEGISSTEASRALRDFAAAHHESVRELSAGEKAQALFALAQEKAQSHLKDAVDGTQSLAQKQEALGAALTNLKTIIGEIFAVGLGKIVTDLAIFARATVEGALAMEEWVKKHKAFVDGLLKIASLLEGPLRPLFEFLQLLDRFAKTLGIAQKAEDDAALSTKDVTDALKQLGPTEEEAAAKAEALAKAHETLARAIEDGEVRIQQAETNLSRVEEDTNIRLFRAVRDRRVAYAQQARAITDSEANLAKAVEDRRRKIRDDQEKIADLQREDLRKRQDEVDQLKKIEQQRANNITDALIAVEEALRHHDDAAFNAAQRDLARARQDSAVADQKKKIQQDDADRTLAIARAQRQLREDQIDADAAVAKAKEDLRRTVEDQDLKIIEAEEKVTDAIRQNKREIDDARIALKTAQRDTKRSVDDATDAYIKLGGRIGDVIERTIVLSQETQKLVDILNHPALTSSDTLPGRGGDNTGKTLAEILLEGVGGKMAGGPFSGPFVAGERGPELVIPDGSQTGNVINNNDFMKLLKQMAEGNKGGNTFQITVPDDPEAIAFAVSSRLAQSVNG